ncbi:MAG: carbonic anhydrase [Gammaproteobacteria bacterium]|nr:carbonic anhydrase [Gammaproteobacteria bacterium]MCP4091613.1 carbonic anhydrase [Gammaproteobacteria bacterium]MCP4276109.1 carbonic anhydrase [Gammaproteobacteria bacterium]MCP4830853.1 carbonic anhydrase [Gammaproteobacteria bacterium]MCP4929679.1 carbonic anhydrase [Gammaproteobacteria bacterium]
MPSIPAGEALQRLRDGNKRFYLDELSHGDLANPARRNELVDGQNPFAIILGCSDSRAPVELVFDQGLGDLFVIRVAGNIVAPSQIGSIEYAVAEFGVQLVVVLGHSNCGAIEATIDAINDKDHNYSRNLDFIVNQVRPSVEHLISSQSLENRKELARKAVEANVSSSVQQLQHDSGILEKLISQDKLYIVGAKYSLDTGVVDFFEGLPEDI